MPSFGVASKARASTTWFASPACTRGSLYQVFASKRALFLTVLRQLLPAGLDSIRAVDLLLIAALELAVHDTLTEEPARE